MLSFVVPVKNDKNQKHLYMTWLENALNLGISVYLVFDGIEEPNNLRSIEELKLKFESHLFFSFQQVGNPGGVRNIGLEQIQENWVSFIDSDDFVFCNRYLELVEKTIKSNKKIGVGNFATRSGDEIELFDTISKSNGLFTRLIFPGIWRYVIHRDRIGDLQFNEYMGGEDIAFLCELRIKLSEIQVSHEIIYLYSTNIEGQLTRSIEMRQQLRGVLGSLSKLKIHEHGIQTFSLLLRIQLRLQFLILSIRKLFAR